LEAAAAADLVRAALADSRIPAPGDGPPTVIGTTIAVAARPTDPSPEDSPHEGIDTRREHR
jgi:hypothetical protein